MKVRYLLDYPTVPHGEARDTAYSQRNWDAYWFTRAIKGEEITEPAYVKLTKYAPSFIKTDRLDRVRESAAVGICARWAAEVVKDEWADGRIALVPIPGKDGLWERLPMMCPALRLATNIETLIPETVRVYDCLRWARSLEPAHRGGSRDPDELYDALRVRGRKPPANQRKTILIDDVVTSGAHMQAAKRLLEESGAAVTGGLSAAHSTPYDKCAAPFSSGSIEL